MADLTEIEADDFNLNINRYVDTAEQAQARRWSGSKLERDDSLRERVLSDLQQCRSPEQVAGRLALETGRTVI